MRIFSDSWIMFKRCLTTTLRNPESFGQAIIVPAFLMWVFAQVFGNVMDVGAYNYIDFIIPGIILQAASQGISSTAICVNNDMSRGIVDRFRSMPIARSAVLTGHVLASVLRCMIAAAIIIGVGVLLGARPQASFAGWFIIASVLIVFMLGITWISVICGLVAKTPESAGTMMFPVFLLPFISSGFAPTETMSAGLRAFAQHQPMTPIIDTIRAIMMGMPAGNALPAALAWGAGITVAAFVISVQIYKRKLA